MKKFDIEAAKSGMPVQTRDGRPVKIIYFDLKNRCPIIGIISYEDSHEEYFTYFKDGKFLLEHVSDLDLFMAPKTVTRWMAIYCNGLNGGLFETQEQAKQFGGNNVFRYVKVEWEE